MLARRGRMLWAVAVVLLAGCSPEVSGNSALAKGESLGEMRQQAGEALARYDQAVVDAGGSAPVTVTPPAWNSPPGLSIESATGTAVSTRLSVTFTGARGPATESCGADYYAEAVESANAVVVIVIAQPHGGDETCALAGYVRTATLNLAQPLGRRAVLEACQGQPVPVTAGG